MLPNKDDYHRAIANSLLISTDNAHGIHPNYPDKHDANHGPLLNKGPVIKVNANQRYATNSETSGYFVSLCDANNVPHQTFVTRTDMACGSTIGPITAKNAWSKNARCWRTHLRHAFHTGTSWLRGRLFVGPSFKGILLRCRTSRGCRPIVAQRTGLTRSNPGIADLCTPLWV